MLRGAAGSGIGKNGHRSLAGELTEIADEVSLVEVFSLERDVGPVRAIGAVGDAAGMAEAQHARETFRSESGFFETATAELAGAEIGVTRDDVKIGVAVGGGKRFDGLLRGIGRSGGLRRTCSPPGPGSAGLGVPRRAPAAGGRGRAARRRGAAP